jgi:histone H3/H4
MNKPETLADLNAHILYIQKQAVTEWMNKHSDESIKQKVHELLDSNLKETSLKLLGFDNRWGKWEVDHRSEKHTAAKEYIANLIESSFKEWMDNLVLDEIKRMPKVSIKRAAVNEFKSQIGWNLKRKIKNTVSDLAEEYSEAIAEQLNSEMRLIKESRLLSLINPEDR